MNPNYLDSIHCLFKKRIPIRDAAITYRDVVENGNPLSNIKLGCAKNIQPEKITPVATTE